MNGYRPDLEVPDLIRPTKHRRNFVSIALAGAEDKACRNALIHKWNHEEVVPSVLIVDTRDEVVGIEGDVFQLTPAGVQPIYGMVIADKEDLAESVD